MPNVIRRAVAGHHAVGKAVVLTDGWADISGTAARADPEESRFQILARNTA